MVNPSKPQMQSAPTVAEALLQMLRAAGIDAGFGIPGGQTIPFYAAARRCGFRHVLMRDERNAACAADAYARVTGRVGFCDATLGPGATNLISGIAEAYASSIAMIALVADVKTTREHLRDRGVASQALEQRSLFSSIAKWYGRVHGPEVLADVVRHALRVAVSGRPGPVILEIPEDVFAMPYPGDAAAAGFESDDSQWPRYRPAPAAVDVDAILNHLRTAQRPIILAGGGALASGAGELIQRLADGHGLPVVTSINGKGIIAETHPRAFGPVGVFGNVRASHALRQADVVLALGTKFAQFNSFLFRLPTPQQTVLQVDVDGAELGRAVAVKVGVTADVAMTLAAVVAGLAEEGRRWDWQPSADAPAQPGTGDDDPAVAPESVIAALDETASPRDVFVTDASLASGWAAPRFRVKAAGRHFLAPRGLAGIGWAGGAAVGAALALPANSRIIALAGDGAAGYWLGEIETAVRLQLPITFVILNNAGYGWVVQGERMLGITPQSEFAPVDFAAVARGFGAAAFTIRRGDDIAATVREAHAVSGPSLIDVLSSDRAQPSVDWGVLDPSAQHRYGAYGMG